jgi:hypothetical protein
MCQRKLLLSGQPESKERKKEEARVAISLLRSCSHMTRKLPTPHLLKVTPPLNSTISWEPQL